MSFTPFDTHTGAGGEYSQAWKTDAGQIPDIEGRYCLQVRMGTRGKTTSGLECDHYATQSTTIAYDAVPPGLTLSAPTDGIDPDKANYKLGFSTTESLHLYRVALLDSAESKVLYEPRPVKNSVNPGQAIAWNGRDSSGAPFPDGSYTFRVKAFDYAAQTYDQYEAKLKLVSAIPLLDSLPIAPEFDSLWRQFENPDGQFVPGVNGTVKSMRFRIKRAMPASP